jgi:hypothetical protein
VPRGQRLGYGAHHIKDYFLNYKETSSNDFVLRGGDVELLGSDIRDWTIIFVHTGLDSSIGERLRRVRALVQDEEMFLANYADVLTDLPLNDMIAQFAGSDAVGALLAVPPQAAFHYVDVAENGRIEAIVSTGGSGSRPTPSRSELRWRPRTRAAVAPGCCGKRRTETPSRRRSPPSTCHSRSITSGEPRMAVTRGRAVRRTAHTGDRALLTGLDFGRLDEGVCSCVFC